MLSGLLLQNDADFDYAIQNGQDVEVLLDGELDYVGRVVGYNREVFEVMSGDYYLRGVAEVKTK